MIKSIQNYPVDKELNLNCGEYQIGHYPRSIAFILYKSCENLIPKFENNE